MRHLDLFSGIGGFALAASWVWPYHHVVSFCEIDPFCRKVLNKHWPDTPIHDDIKTFDGKQYAGTISLLTGGFPCQPYSVAGKQRGKDDDRALWPEMLRVISEIHPTCIIGENVGGFVNMGFDDCASDLESEGYEVQAFIIPACAVNAPHRRDRIWIVANRSQQLFDGCRIAGPGGREEHTDSHCNAPNSQNRKNDMRNGGDMAETERCRESINPAACAGDNPAQNPHCGGMRGRSDGDQAGSERTLQIKRSDCDATHSGNERLQGSQRPGTHDERPTPHGSVAERDCIRDHTDSDRNGSQKPWAELKTGRGRQFIQGRERWSEPWIEAATRLCTLDDGLPRRLVRPKGWRVNALKAAGNAIVPQVAYEIMKSISKVEAQK